MSTTQIFEDAVKLSGTLPDDQYVFVTGPHTKRLLELEHRFKEEGLVGIKFIPLQEILDRGIRGHSGILLVDDWDDLTLNQQTKVCSEKVLLNNRRR